MKLLKFLLLVVLLLFVVQCPVNAALKVTPTRFEYSTKQVNGKNFINGSILVQAGKDETVRFKVYPHYFEILPDGRIDTTENMSSPNKISSIRFNPAEFTLSGGVPQKVRFTITNLKEMPDGESRTALFFEDVKLKEQYLPTPSKDISAHLSIKTIIAVPIYVDKGQVTKIGEIKNIEFKKQNEKYLYKVNVLSKGNSKIRPDGKIQIIKGDELVNEIPITSIPIQAGKTGLIVGEIPINKLSPSENYKLKIQLSFKDQKDKQQYITNIVDFKMDEIQQPLINVDKN